MSTPDHALSGLEVLCLQELLKADFREWDRRGRPRVPVGAYFSVHTLPNGERIAPVVPLLLERGLIFSAPDDARFVAISKSGVFAVSMVMRVLGVPLPWDN